MMLSYQRASITRLIFALPDAGGSSCAVREAQDFFCAFVLSFYGVGVGSTWIRAPLFFTVPVTGPFGGGKDF
jgi:hypothetical protein